ncbi:MAG: zinc ABC transporter substrate-binding protein [Halieaceae bacterium]|nr:zinc ABC transporter substrate-binding protein [Halieaceae bacterium]
MKHRTSKTKFSKLMPRRFTLALAMAVLFQAAITGAATAADTSVRVVATIKPLHSLVSAVMAGLGEPHLIMRGAVTPHTFSLRPSDAAVLANAQVVFLIGESLETSLTGPIDTLAGSAQVVALSEARDLVQRPLRVGARFEAHGHGIEGEHGHHEEDPEEHSEKEEVSHGEDDHDSHGQAVFDMHIWLDPVNAGVMARTIAATLSRVDPDNAAGYMANAEALLQRLDTLGAQISREVAPIRGKPFIVFHDAYRHFEDRFGLTAVGSAVVSADRPPGARRIMELRTKVRELGVTCVLTEPQFEPRLVNVIIEGTPARAGTVDPLGADIISGPELYFSLLRNMAASFRDCLAPVAEK